MALKRRHLTAVTLASALAVLWGLAPVASQERIPLTPGMVIDRSVTIRPGTYRIPAADDLKTPAITIRGENIVVDFNGATLVGSPETADPDQFAGVGVLVDGGSKVTIRGATIRGYKVGILARDSPDLHLTRNDLSYNWKQRLRSGIEKESLLDWMSYHQNEKDEWLRYGAAIYLRNCDRAEIDHNTAVQGQNGLMVTASKGLKIWNNTFQFLSSIGVGLYRVSESTIMHNRIDWCVRGYSHGYYNRGQDSAGLLMYEQSSNNVVAYNSITHGGDGLFLWAGQSTMDTGEGGSNDNLFWGNDFSHAPTNGIEATFSRNTFIANRIEDNWHGVWGGYSYGSIWSDNRFKRNAEAIAIEHGSKNVIHKNTFDSDDVGVRLWQNATQDPGWEYPKRRDTRSRDYRIERNTFVGTRSALEIRDTRYVTIFGNSAKDVRTFLTTAGETPELDVDGGDVLVRMDWPAVDPPPRRPDGIDPMLPPGARRGRETIIVDEWGPYDWKAPKLWPVLSGGDRVLPFPRVAKAAGAFDGPIKLNVHGPEGAWKLVSARGATVTPTSGKVGDVISVAPRRGPVVDYEIVMSYVGGEVASPRGVVTPAGEPHLFRYARFFAPASWTMSFYELPEPLHPARDPENFARLVKGKPVVPPVKRDRIDYLSGRLPFEDGVPSDRFALVAEGVVNLPPGDYELQVISDDGVRVWVDGKLALDAWEPHGSRLDFVQLSSGRRRLKVEYYELTGWAELTIDLQPRRKGTEWNR